MTKVVSSVTVVPMKLRFHTVGASGSGTTTLAIGLASYLKLAHFDADDYYWKPTNPPFTTKRPVEERVALLTNDLEEHPSWVLSGSLVNWGDQIKHRFTHVIFLSLPQPLRIARLREREIRKFGTRINLGGDMHQQHLDFIQWAMKYDNGGLDVRSMQLHEQWFKDLNCPVIRLSGEFTTDEQVRRIVQSIKTPG